MGQFFRRKPIIQFEGRRGLLPSLKVNFVEMSNACIPFDVIHLCTVFCSPELDLDAEENVSKRSPGAT